jgi:hypothetical protein
MTSARPAAPYRPPSPARDPAAERAEQAVRRVAQLVLAATSLADRLEHLGATDAARHRSERITQLREAAAAGRRALLRMAVDDAFVRSFDAAGTSPTGGRDVPAAAGSLPG